MYQLKLEIKSEAYPSGGRGEPWYYGVQRDKVGAVGHSLVRTPNRIIYEINHPDNGRTDGLIVHFLLTL